MQVASLTVRHSPKRWVCSDSSVTLDVLLPLSGISSHDEKASVENVKTRMMISKDAFFMITSSIKNKLYINVIIHMMLCQRFCVMAV